MMNSFFVTSFIVSVTVRSSVATDAKAVQADSSTCESQMADGCQLYKRYWCDLDTATYNSCQDFFDTQSDVGSFWVVVDDGDECRYYCSGRPSEDLAQPALKAEEAREITAYSSTCASQMEDGCQLYKRFWCDLDTATYNSCQDFFDTQKAVGSFWVVVDDGDECRYYCSGRPSDELAQPALKAKEERQITADSSTCASQMEDGCQLYKRYWCDLDTATYKSCQDFFDTQSAVGSFWVVVDDGDECRYYCSGRPSVDIAQPALKVEEARQMTQISGDSSSTCESQMADGCQLYKRFWCDLDTKTYNSCQDFFDTQSDVGSFWVVVDDGDECRYYCSGGPSDDLAQPEVQVKEEARQITAHSTTCESQMADGCQLYKRFWCDLDTATYNSCQDFFDTQKAVGSFWVVVDDGDECRYYCSGRPSDDLKLAQPAVKVEEARQITADSSTCESQMADGCQLYKRYWCDLDTATYNSCQDFFDTQSAVGSFWVVVDDGDECRYYCSGRPSVDLESVKAVSSPVDSINMAPESALNQWGAASLWMLAGMIVGCFGSKMCLGRGDKHDYQRIGMEDE